MSVINKRMYTYTNLFSLYEDPNAYMLLGQDGYIYKDNEPISNINNIKQFYSNYNAFICVTNDGYVYTGNSVKTFTKVNGLENIVWVSGGGQNPTYMAISKDHKLYGWGSNTTFALGISGKYNIPSPIEIELPNDELPFMCSMSGEQSAILTMKGNVYFAGKDTYFTSSTNKNSKVWTKINIDNVTWVNISGGKLGLQLYMVKDDSSLYVVGGTDYVGPNPHPVSNISNVKTVWGNNSEYVICVTHDHKLYSIKGNDVIKITTNNDMMIGTTNDNRRSTIMDLNKKIYTSGHPNENEKFVDSSVVLDRVRMENVGLCIPTIERTYKAYNGIEYYYRTLFDEVDVIYDDSGEPVRVDVRIKTEYGLDETYGTIFKTNIETFTINNYTQYEYILNERYNKQKQALLTYLNTLIGTIIIPQDKYMTHNATNGNKYYIRTSFTKKESNDTSYSVIVKTEYSLTESYERLFNEQERVIDSNNYKLAESIIDTEAEEQIKNCKTYIDSIIESVDSPDDIVEEYKTKSGKMFYIRTVYTIMKTNYIGEVTYKTYYGPDKSYSIFYKQGKYVIDPTNYKDYKSTIEDLGTNQHRECVREALKIWDIEVPKIYTKTFINSGGYPYYLTVQFFQGEITDNENSIIIEASYGEKILERTANFVNKRTYFIGISNYDRALTDITAIRDEFISDMESDLQIPNVNSKIPRDFIKIYNVNDVEYHIRISYKSTVKDPNIVDLYAYIDGVQFGEPNKYIFTRNVSEALDNLEQFKLNKIEEIERTLVTTPVNTINVFTKGGCKFRISNKYKKKSGNTIMTIESYIDESLYESKLYPINYVNLINSIEEIKTATNEMNKRIELVLGNCPDDIMDNVLTISDMKFDLKCFLYKKDNEKTFTYKTMCDDFVYSTEKIDFKDVKNIGNTFEILSIKSISSVNVLENYIKSKVIKDDVITVTYDGFNYIFGTQFVKDIKSKIIRASVILDNKPYGYISDNIESLDDITSIMTKLKQGVEETKTWLASKLQNYPKDYNEIYTMNGFSYNLSTRFIKQGGVKDVYIYTYMDGLQYSEDLSSIDIDSLDYDMDQCKNMGIYRMNELKEALSKSPKDNYNAVYNIKETPYMLGAKYYKAANSRNVNIKILLDNKIVKEYNETIGVGDIESDLIYISDLSNKDIKELEPRLKVIEDDKEEYKLNDYNFVFKNKYIKDPSLGTIDIESYIDETLYKKRTFEFELDKIDGYKLYGFNMIEEMRDKSNEVPNNIREKYNIYGMNFTVGIDFVKPLYDNNIYIYKVVDKNRIGLPTIDIFEFDKINEIIEQANKDLTEVKLTLNKLPENYDEEYRLQDMNFSIESTFYKDIDSKYIELRTKLDRRTYGEVINILFDINQIQSIINSAKEKREALKEIINTAPRNSLEVYQYKNYKFNIEKVYHKQAGELNYIAQVKLDGIQYEDPIERIFNPDHINTMYEYVDKVVEELKEKIRTNMSEDIHKTYYKDGYNFLLDILFSKEAGNPKIKVDYTISEGEIALEGNDLSNISSEDFNLLKM